MLHKPTRKEIDMRLEYEATRDRYEPDAWRVEAIDYGNDGEVYVAIFTGPAAQRRAEEYARFKNELGSESNFDVDKVYAGLRT